VTFPPHRPAPRASFVRFGREEIEQSIPARFERQVDAYPGRVAMVWAETTWTYEALDRAANRIAHSIPKASGTADQPVVLLIEQGAPLVAAILGVLKTGRPYVPLETTHQPGYVAGVVEESGARLLLTDKAGGRLAGESNPAVDTIRIDRILAGGGTDARLDLSVAPDASAYIYYTSGSTGRPKGVIDTHRNVLHNVMRYTNSLGIDRDDRLTLLQSPSFSGAVSSLFGALLNGAAVFPWDMRRMGAAELGAWLVRHRITIYHSVPALFRHAVAGAEAFPDLRLVRLEGDQMSRRDWDVFHQHFSGGCVLVNGLGATECGLVRQYFIDAAMPPAEGLVPIGYPVEDMEVEVVDESGRRVEAGQVGTIAVRSRYLATGYWRRPDLTAPAFTEHPGAPGMRTYRTGDLGRFRADNCLEHLGRSDTRRKLRGHWVDLADVEAALLGAPGVREAAVRVREDLPGHARLVAYIVPEGPEPTSEGVLRDYLSPRLNPVALPSAFVVLTRLPLTQHGKLDRDALPAPAHPTPANGTGLPRPDTAYLRDCAAAVLDLPASAVADDQTLIALGVDSLGALRMAHQIRVDLGLSISIATILDATSLQALAATIALTPPGSTDGLLRSERS
jgi:amino acid adenylation domain-containing protein